MTPVEYAKAYLATHRQELRLRLDSVERSRQHAEVSLSQDSEERATERENDEVLDRLEEVTRSELRRIEHAMERIDTGHYGECEICRQPIAPSRLRVVPEATRCAQCAQTSRPH